jgi:hypothetical protein
MQPIAQPAGVKPVPHAPGSRVLFLDFDGVIITPRSHIALGRQGGLMVDPDPVALGAIRKLCDTGVRLVVTSAWRLNAERCRRFLEEHELIGYLHTDWHTRRDNQGTHDSRGAQIGDWLAAHPEVRTYRIVDDDRDIRPQQLPYFILCNAMDGISYIGLKKLLEWAGVIDDPKEAA